MKAFATWDGLTESQYRRWRAPKNAVYRAVTVGGMLGCELLLGQLNMWTVTTAAGCLLLATPLPTLALVLFTALQFQLFSHCLFSPVGLVLGLTLQVLPGVSAFPGQTLRQAAFTSLSTGLALYHSLDFSASQLLLTLGALLAIVTLVLVETAFRLQFLYQDFEGSGKTALQEVIHVLGSAILVLQPNQVLYANEAAYKLLKAKTNIDISRRIAAFQLVSPGPNLSAGKNQPLWSEINGLARKPRPGEVQLRRYAVDMEGGHLAVTLSGRCVQWQGHAQAVVITVAEMGRAEPQANRGTGVELRRLQNDIYSSAKLAREQPCSTSFNDLDRAILTQYYHLYTMQDLADLSAGRALSPVLQSLTLQDEIQQIIDLFSLQTRTKRLNLQITASPALPEVVKMDQLRLRQVLFPALSFALNRSDEGNTVNMTFSEVDGVQVTIAYQGGRGGEEADPYLQAAVALARTVGKGLRLQPGLIAFSLPSQGGDVRSSSDFGYKRT